MTFTIPRPEWVSDRLIEERGEHAGFQMYTREGNDAVADLLLSILRDADKVEAPRRTVVEAVRQAMNGIAHDHPEVNDTEPEWAITDALNAFLSERGFAQVHREDLFA